MYLKYFLHFEIKMAKPNKLKTKFTLKFKITHIILLNALHMGDYSQSPRKNKYESESQ